jgi:hypothetical protein
MYVRLCNMAFNTSNYDGHDDDSKNNNLSASFSNSVIQLILIIS